jgi:hypothetical protein
MVGAPFAMTPNGPDDPEVESQLVRTDGMRRPVSDGMR